jgi:acyl dehydratase
MTLLALTSIVLSTGSSLSSGCSSPGPVTMRGDVAGIAELVGAELGPSRWLEVDQERIDRFARATDDPQWIHTDAERAAAGPFGTTIAHGFLTLSLCVPCLYELLHVDGYRLTVNYGVNRVRFPAPVPAGSRVRARFRVESVEEVPGGDQAVIVATVEREGGEKPVCVAELVVRLLR